MKIGIFTDVHYCHAKRLCGTRRPSLSSDKLREAMTAFRKAGVDICLCLGDLTDHAPHDTKENVLSCLDEMLSLIHSFGIPFYLVPGNHDYLVTRFDELFARLSQPTLPFFLDFGTLRLIFLDANYRSDMRRFDEAGVVWTDANLPPEQLAFLTRALDTATGEAIVILHECLDPLTDTDHIVKNADAVRALLENSGKVRTVWQGHYHPGADHTVNGIRYVTFPAMCEGEGNAFSIQTVTV